MQKVKQEREGQGRREREIRRERERGGENEARIIEYMLFDYYRKLLLSAILCVLAVGYCQNLPPILINA